MKNSNGIVKRILFVVVVILTVLAVLSCGKVKEFSMGPLEMADGSAVDDSTHPFESSSDYAGFSIYNVPSNLKFTSAAISTEHVYKGAASLKVGVDYNASNSGGVLSMTGTAIPMAGKTITAHVWIPNSMFPTDYPYGASFFIQLPNYNWYQSTWQNLAGPSGNIPGQWNTITTTVDTMTLANGLIPGNIGQTLSQNSEDGDTAIIWGLKVGQGGSSPDYSGYIYIDSITIE